MKALPKTIGQVAKLAGITPYVIRAWEKRFTITDPARSSTNRRLYGESDVTKLCLLADLTNSGFSIGQIAELSHEELEALTAQKARESGISEFSLEASEDDFVGQALAHVVAMDSNQLQSLFHKVNMSLTKPHLIKDFLTPLLHQVGERWERGELRVAHEHMCAACVKSFLSNLLMNHTIPSSARTVIACTPQGQEHEIGALAASLTAKVNGWNVCYLGPDLPAEEIAASAVQCKASAVLLSISYPMPVLVQFEELRKLLPNCPLIVGGRVVDRLRQPLIELNYTIVGSLDELPKQLLAL